MLACLLNSYTTLTIVTFILMFLLFAEGMSLWNLLVTTVRFIITKTFNWAYSWGVGQFVEEASPPQ